MWELIRVNKRNSVLLLGAMGSVLLLLGFVLGMLFGGAQAGWVGMAVATAIWLVMMLVSLSGGDQIMLTASKAVPVTHDVHPMLFNVVEEMTIAANLPKMPKIYIINDPAPNASASRPHVQRHPGPEGTNQPGRCGGARGHPEAA